MIRGDGLMPSIYGLDNRHRDASMGPGRQGLNSIFQLPIQAAHKKGDQLDRLGRRSPNPKTYTASGKESSTLSALGIIPQSQSVSKNSSNVDLFSAISAPERPTLMSADGSKNGKNHAQQENLYLSTFYQDGVEQDKTPTFQFLQSTHGDFPLPPAASTTTAAINMSEAPKFDFCNPELYDDPFADQVLDTDMHQVSRVMPATYTDSIPRIQRSLSKKHDLTYSAASTGIGLSGHDSLAKSMEFNSIIGKSRQRVIGGAGAIGPGHLPIPSSMSFAYLQPHPGESTSRSMYPNLKKHQSDNIPASRSALFKISRSQSQAHDSTDSDSRGSDVFPVHDASNITESRGNECDNNNCKDQNQNQNKEQITPIMPNKAIHQPHTALSPTTPCILQGEPGRASLCPLNNTILHPRHTFKTLKPSQTMQYINPYGRSTTFKSAYMATFSHGHMDEHRSFLFKTKRVQQSSELQQVEFRDHCTALQDRDGSPSPQLYRMHKAGVEHGQRGHTFPTTSHTEGRSFSTQVCDSDSLFLDPSERARAKASNGDPSNPRKIRSLSSNATNEYKDSLPLILLSDRRSHNRGNTEAFQMLAPAGASTNISLDPSIRSNFNNLHGQDTGTGDAQKKRSVMQQSPRATSGAGSATSVAKVRDNNQRAFTMHNPTKPLDPSRVAQALQRS